MTCTGTYGSGAQDWYDGGYYAKSPTDDPTGPATGSDRVFRGGGWTLPARLPVGVPRRGHVPETATHYLGLRVSRVAGDTAPSAMPSPPCR